MEAKSINKKTLRFLNDERELGELIYRNLFSRRAEITLPNFEFYDVRPVGFFGTNVSVTKNGVEIASIKLHWRGKMLLTFRDGREFVLKAKGALYKEYIIENKEGQTLFQLQPKYNWRHFRYNYNITSNKRLPDVLLIIVGVYATNYFKSAMAGAV